jgi:hypothetical protein
MHDAIFTAFFHLLALGASLMPPAGDVRSDFQLSHNRCARTAAASYATADERIQGIFRKGIR